MIPIILLGVGAYLIYDSQKPQKMANGGDVYTRYSVRVLQKKTNTITVFYVNSLDEIDKRQYSIISVSENLKEFAEGGAVKRLYENGGVIIENPVFTFKTDNDYHNARSSGYIDDYDIVRIEVKHPSGGGVDFATHSEEEYFEALKRIRESGAEIVRTYQDKMYYDINDYYDADEDRGGDEDDEYNTGGEIDSARSYVMFIDTLQDAERLGFGGKVKFKDKVKSISENLKGRKVPKRLQKEYGKTYDKKWERDESARRIAGSQLKKMNIN